MRGGDHGHRVFEGGGDGERVNIRARNHDFADLDLAEFHRRLNEFDFAGVDESAFARLLDENLKLLDGTDEGVAGRRSDAEKAHEARGDEVEQLDGPAERVQEPVEWAGDDEGNAFGAGEAEGFRNELAEDDFEPGEKGEGNDESDAMGENSGPRTWNFSDERADEVGKRDFADVAEKQADDGDADLHAGDDVVEVGEKRFDDLGAGVALFNQLVNARSANSDERKLRGGEKSVDENEEKNSSEMKSDHGAANPSAGETRASIKEEGKV